LGLAGSLVVGLLELFVTHGQNRFYRELEEWMSGFTRIGLGGAEGQSLGAAALVSFLERFETQLTGLQQFYHQRDELRDQEASAAERRSLALGQEVERLTGLLGSDRDQLSATLAAERETAAQALAGVERAIVGLNEGQAKLFEAPCHDPALLPALERLADGQARLIALAEAGAPDETALQSSLERLIGEQSRLITLIESSNETSSAMAGRMATLSQALERLAEGQSRLPEQADTGRAPPRTTAVDDPEA